MRSYNSQTKRRLIRVLRNGINAIKNDAIRSPGDLGILCYLIRSIAMEDEIDERESDYEFHTGLCDPNIDSEAFGALVAGWRKAPPRHHIAEAGSADRSPAIELTTEPARMA